MLRRLCYPGRCGDLAKLFGRQRSEMSMITNQMVLFMFEKLDMLLVMSKSTAPRDRLAACAGAVQRKGTTLANYVGFIDGTVRGVAQTTSK